jgi:hypothetical protein
MDTKDETFGFVCDLILRLKNKHNGKAMRAIRSDNDTKFKNAHLKTFCRDLGLKHQFLCCMLLVKMTWSKGKSDRL